MNCNRSWCQLCKIDREGCQCKASDIGCWYCAPHKFQRPQCMVVYEYAPLPTALGYRWVLLDIRGWHVAPVAAAVPKTTICQQPIGISWLGLAPGTNPISISEDQTVCGWCANNAPMMPPLEIQTFIPPPQPDYDAAWHLAQKAKKAEGLADMLEKKASMMTDQKEIEKTEENAAAQRKRAEKLLKERSSKLEPQ